MASSIFTTHSGDRYQSVVSTAAGDLISSGSGDGLCLLGLLCRAPAGPGPVCTHLSELAAVIMPPSAPSLELCCRLQAAGDKCAGRSLQSGLQCCSAACGGHILQVVPRRPDRRCQPSPASPGPAQPLLFAWDFVPFIITLAHRAAPGSSASA